MNSLIPFNHPFFRTGNWWDDSTLGRLFDQDFGLGLMETDPFFNQPMRSSVPYWMRSRAAPIVSNLERGLSEVRNEGDKFSVNLDTSHFSPEEIKVKVVDNNLIIEGKHEEKMDQHGFVTRSFSRRYLLPKDVDPAQLISNLAPNGILRVEAPKKVVENKKERTIPIQFSSGGGAIESGHKGQPRQMNIEHQK